jgi:hypothetical protein
MFQYVVRVVAWCEESMRDWFKYNLLTEFRAARLAGVTTNYIKQATCIMWLRNNALTALAIHPLAVLSTARCNLAIAHSALPDHLSFFGVFSYLQKD